MKIHREPAETERENGNRYRRSENCKEIGKKKEKKGKEEGGEEWETEKQKLNSTIAFPRTSMRTCVRACRVGKPTGCNFAGVYRPPEKSADVQTRSHANSRIYPRVMPIMHARASKRGWAGFKGRDSACDATRGCTTSIIRTSCFLAWRTGLKDVKYAWRCRIMLTPAISACCISTSARLVDISVW